MFFKLNKLSNITIFVIFTPAIMKSFLVLASVLVAIQASVISDSAEQQWQQFKIKHNRNYENETEEQHRKAIFLKNLEEIEAHNKNFEEGIVSHRIGVNQFADKTTEELMSTLNAFKISEPSNATYFHPVNRNLPDSVDWRQKGAVTPVKNQRHCGSCWAFSAIGALEGQLFFKNKKLVSLSEQNLIDCSDKNGGCGGGNAMVAFQYVIDNGGIDTELSYPYQDKRGQCHYQSKNSAGTISNMARIRQGSESDLQAAVATVGPISVMIHSTKNIFKYTDSVFNDKDCKNDMDHLNHIVLVVGYGSENGKDYWIVKNSYGKDFGKDGYIRMSRNKNNQCGIANFATYPIV